MRQADAAESAEVTTHDMQHWVCSVRQYQLGGLGHQLGQRVRGGGEAASGLGRPGSTVITKIPDVTK